MRKVVLVILALVGAYFGYDLGLGPAIEQPSAEQSSATSNNDDVLAQAFKDRRNSYQVSGAGVVDRLLSDDNEGSRHQRFVLRLSSGQSLMVAHNIDVAPRVANLRVGDTVSFYGEYEWNEQGGVIHWTHKADRSSHVDGWLEHNGRRYW